MGQRLNAHGDGTWCPPGGHLEHGESFEQCAKRETKEEAGINIKNVRFVTATNDVFEHENKHYVTIYVLADWVSGEPQVLEPDKLIKWQWVDWRKLPSPLFLPVEHLVESGFDPIHKG